MFISKKKFNEALEKARCEVADKMYQNDRINNIENNLHRRIDVLEERITALETKGKRKHKSENAVMPRWGY